MDTDDFSPQVRKLWALADPCTLCPRQCRVERDKGQIGFCGIADMPDMKYADADVAEELSAAPDYPQINQAAVIEMHRQTGDLHIENGLTTRGLLVRHLVLPDNLAGSFEIIDFLADQISPSTTINIMDQYHPCYKAPR